jgi:hypothetical protein
MTISGDILPRIRYRRAHRTVDREVVLSVSDLVKRFGDTWRSTTSACRCPREPCSAWSTERRRKTTRRQSMVTGLLRPDDGIRFGSRRGCGRIRRSQRNMGGCLWLRLAF